MENNIVNRAIREELTYSNQTFPISEFIDYFDTFADKCFPSHWHDEFELQIILKGSAEYRVNGDTYIVERGSQEGTDMRKKHHFQNCMRGFCYKNPRFNKKLICFRNSFQEVYKILNPKCGCR